MTSAVIDVFFSLLRSGLWEQEVELQPYEPVDFDELYELADQQAVVGLIGAGLEHIADTKVQKMQARPFLKRVVAIELRNREMNEFIKRLFVELGKGDVVAVLVKGQGVGQCYSRPLWRTSGDVDLLMDAQGYENAKALLVPLASSVDKEYAKRKHLGVTIGEFMVELHGTLWSSVSTSIDRVVDAVQERMIVNKEFRDWDCNGMIVPLPSCDNDIIFVFAHILQHFFRGGIGLRQICDWCRLLWVFRDSIDRDLLLERLKKMKAVQEWKVFASLAVDTLGMPLDAMPLYEPSRRYSRKVPKILRIILEKGNFGQNEDRRYYKKKSYLVSKFISLSIWIRDFSKLFVIFPPNSLRAFRNILGRGACAAMKGE